ncbi:energy-coupling factor transporter transmembrane component T [Enterococcus sp. CSURQ0835]|uniref:energy-coupling factor transporter transmembrane component T n=1 Tax=Enterococcus sp. CSURQ0835 TaxID=2681394 RepID=UPI001F44F0F5|nr:energy-coupling factor transporter transmembrane component T [Enterococcus sp. CSURQ0835]
MRRVDAFSTVHPVINFGYFIGVILVGMFCLQPVILTLACLSATSYGVLLKGGRHMLGLWLKFLLPGLLVVTLVNPAFNHYGVTPLFQLQNGNSITLEAIVYGIVLGVVFCCSILWFTCYNDVMTSDKFIYLFGKILPASSLILAMVFRFVPKFNTQLQHVRNGQKSIGRDLSNGTLRQKIKTSFTLFSALVTWSLENAIETADSMKARGYGLKGRTAFSRYRFDRRDFIVTLFLLVTGGLFSYSWFSGALVASYNPKIELSGWPLTTETLLGWVSFTLFATLPLSLELVEALRFKRMERKISDVAVIHQKF